MDSQQSHCPTTVIDSDSDEDDAIKSAISVSSEHSGETIAFYRLARNINWEAVELDGSRAFNSFHSLRVNI